MKKSLAFIIAVLIFVSCKKHTFDEAIPKVNTGTPTLYGADSLVIKGSATAGTYGGVEYVGFCWDTFPNPALTVNQILGKGLAGNFSSVIPYHKGQTYYIKAFAANELGYTAGKLIQYPIDTVPPPSPPTVPCSLNNNSFTENGINYSATGSKSLVPSYGNYGVIINLSNGDFLEFDFASPPHNGTYTTTTASSNIVSSQVYASIITNVSTGANNVYDINNGQSVYITVSGSTITLATCSLNYVDNNGFVVGNISGKVSY